MKKFLLAGMMVIAVMMTAYGQTPLSTYSKKWNDPKYKICNTAAHVRYMSDKEKELIYVLNMARMDPKLFCETVVKTYPDSVDIALRSNSYYLSLMSWLPTLSPAPLLQPDSLCYVSAHCHASVSGKSGYAGHSRTPECLPLKHYHGEACDYGNYKPLSILMSLFIDDGVPSLGHRTGCFNTEFISVGVSMEPHEKYGMSAVIDFYR